jgi:hypothetical protein
MASNVIVGVVVAVAVVVAMVIGFLWIRRRQGVGIDPVEKDWNERYNLMYRALDLEYELLGTDSDWKHTSARRDQIVMYQQIMDWLKRNRMFDVSLPENTGQQYDLSNNIIDLYNKAHTGL